MWRNNIHPFHHSGVKNKDLVDWPRTSRDTGKCGREFLISIGNKVRSHTSRWKQDEPADFY